jgi:hypothetical protein
MAGPRQEFENCTSCECCGCWSAACHHLTRKLCECEISMRESVCFFLCALPMKCIKRTLNAEVVSVRPRVSSPSLLDGFRCNSVLGPILFWFIYVNDWLFNTFTATLRIWRPFPPSATRGRAMTWWQRTHHQHYIHEKVHSRSNSRSVRWYLVQNSLCSPLLSENPKSKINYIVTRCFSWVQKLVCHAKGKIR